MCCARPDTKNLVNRFTNFPMKKKLLARLVIALAGPPVLAVAVSPLAMFALWPSDYTRIDREADGAVKVARMNAMHDYGTSAVHNLFLINSGAIIGVLTFLGHMFSTNDEQRIELARTLTLGILPSLAGFVAGLFSSVVMGLAFYYGILFDMRGYEDLRVWRLFHFAVLTSSLYFITGATFGALAFYSLARPSTMDK